MPQTPCRLEAVHGGDGIQGKPGRTFTVATRGQTAYFPHRSASQWQATDGGGVAQLGSANLVVNFVSQPTLVGGCDLQSMLESAL